jgi:hypothetical protein
MLMGFAKIVVLIEASIQKACHHIFGFFPVIPTGH